jgi:hypothetical protein
MAQQTQTQTQTRTEKPTHTMQWGRPVLLSETKPFDEKLEKEAANVRTILILTIVSICFTQLVSIYFFLHVANI